MGLALAAQAKSRAVIAASAISPSSISQQLATYFVIDMWRGVPS